MIKITALKESFPSLKTAWEGMLIGVAIAIAVSGVYATSMHLAGAPWEHVIEQAYQLVVVLIPTFAGTVAACLLIRYNGRSMPPLITQPAFLNKEEVSIAVTSPTLQEGSAAEDIFRQAYLQAEMYYKDGKEPTRRTMERQGVSQPLWNSGRHVLRAAHIVTEEGWADAEWRQVRRLLGSTEVDHSSIQVRVLGKSNFTILQVSDKLQAGNKYTR